MHTADFFTGVARLSADVDCSLCARKRRGLRRRQYPPLIPVFGNTQLARQSGGDGRGDNAGFRITEIPADDSVAVPNRSMSERRRTDRVPRAVERSRPTCQGDPSGLACARLPAAVVQHARRDHRTRHDTCPRHNPACAHAHGWVDRTRRLIR